ncbi:MAG: protease complex subunit PrcB family protein [Lachnospiraceae bacterium]|nr:protease complex subunit PrcB family protein [Lachnospiraceae bacterium]
MKKIIIVFLTICTCACLLCACSIGESKTEKLRDLDFTVVSDDRLPEELKAILEEKKQNEFKITFQDDKYLYICMGYGQQQTGGYSVSVKELYLTENAIYVDTDLLGPSASETIAKTPSYPYIVIKIEYLDKTVVFQ